jgi:hypothetical protein
MVKEVRFFRAMKKLAIFCFLVTEIAIYSKPVVKFISPSCNSSVTISSIQQYAMEILVDGLPSVKCSNYNLAIYSTNPPKELQHLSLCTCSEEIPGQLLPHACSIDVWLHQVIFFVPS